MSKFLENIKDKIMELNVIEIFILFSPFIDLFTSLSIKLPITIGMIIRIIFLVYMIYYLIIINNSIYRKISIIYLIIIIIYFLLSIYNSIDVKGYTVLLPEIKALIKSFYFPIILICFFNFFKERGNNFKERIFVIVSIIYLFTILLADITNTTSLSYSSGKLGHVGWFYSPNEVGGLLSILSPFIILFLINFRKKPKTYFLFILYTLLMLQIGTKVPLLSILLSLFSILIVLISRFIITKNKHHVNIIVFPIIIFITSLLIIYPITPTAYNLNLHLKWLKISSASDLEKHKLNNLIFSSRDKYKKELESNRLNVSFREKALGMGYINKEEDKVNMAEIDYFDSYYMYGYIGFFIYYLLFIIIFILIVIKFLEKIKYKLFDEKIVIKLISLMLIIGISYFAGHIFVSPSVSIYVALISVLLFKDLGLYQKIEKDFNLKIDKPKMTLKKDLTGGIYVMDTSYKKLISLIEYDIESNKKKYIVAVNPEKILLSRKDNKLKRILNKANYQIADGIMICFAAFIRRASARTRVTGIDTMDKLCELANKKGYKVFLYGAKEDAVNKAKLELELKYSNIKIVGVLNGYISDNEEIIEKINKNKPHILFVALGSPKQEYWISDNIDKLNVNILQGVGGSFDVIGGDKKRAPTWMRKVGLEWFYRLIKEPKRIFRQINLLKFILLIIIRRD